jgi:hypothetical protein
MAAAHEVLDLRRKGGQGRLFENLFKLRSVFALADSDAVRVLRPTWANVVAVAKQAFIAVDEFRHGFACVIAPPRFRVGRLLRLLSRSFKIRDRSQKENERNQLELFLHCIYSKSILTFQILKSEGRGYKGDLKSCDYESA